jgi:hypothetical protein
MPADWSSVYEDRKPGEGEITQDIREKYPDIFSKPAGYLLEKKETTPTAAPTAPETETPLAAPPDAGRPDFKNMSTGERANMSIGEKAMLTMQNVPESFSKNTGDIAYAVTNPVETAGVLWNVGEGAVSKAAGALGFEQDKAQKAKTEGALDASISGLAERFGSWEGFEEALITDPIGVLMDLGTFIPLAGAGAKAAGLAKAAKVLDTAKYLDPLTAAGAATNAVMTPVLDIAKQGLGLSTSMGKQALDWTQEVSRFGDKSMRNDLLRFSYGNADPSDVINAVKGSISEKKAAASKEFTDRKSKLATEQLPPNELQDAISNATNELQPLIDNKGNVYSGRGYDDELNAILKADQIVKSNRDFSAVGMHELKVSIRNLFNKAGVFNSPKSGLLNEVPNSIKRTIDAVDPQYQKMMDFWADHMDEINNITDSVGKMGRKGSVYHLAKMLKDLRGGKNKSIIDDLSKMPSGKNLKAMLAGASMHELFPNWIQQANPLLQTLGGVGVGTGAAFGMIPHIAGTIAASSPRLVGSAMYGAGAVQRAGKAAADVLRTPTWAASTLGELAQEQSEENPIIKTEATPVQSVQGSMFAGGRIGRRSGGRVGNPGSVAEKLIRAAEQAKNRHSDGTSPLLNVPDEAITKALAIANEKI